MGTEATTTNEAPLIPSERVDDLVQLVKSSTQTSLFRLSIATDRTPGLTDTKLGGTPYWPASLVYPTNRKGTKLMLLAQLRLTDFHGCDRLPDHGLIQFFIDSEDDCSGMDFDKCCASPTGEIRTSCRRAGPRGRTLRGPAKRRGAPGPCLVRGAPHHAACETLATWPATSWRRWALPLARHLRAVELGLAEED